VPVFSVILPTFNRARMARTALSTVLAQTFEDWECLVVDDGSADETPKLLAAVEDERVRVLRNEKNLGMNASRNKAIAEAKGRFVTFLDSDDLWLPERLARFAARAKEKPEAGFLFSNAYVHRYGRVIGLLFSRDRAIPEGPVPGHYAIGDRHLPYVTTNVAIKAGAFKDWGDFKTDMKTLDTELFARFLSKGLPVAAIKEPLSVRRIHGAQLTDRAAENLDEALIALESSGADEPTKERLREEITAEVAMYLVKAGEPAKARSLLESRLGARAKALRVYALTRLPPVALKAARALRELHLRARPGAPGVPSRELRRVSAWLKPLLAAE
jgi:glycosyltransferase involved in cell wall biosynthesis